jgi:penicillin-binding protein 1A
VAKFATARRILGWGIAIAAATFALSVGIVAGKVFVWLRAQGVFAITDADVAKVTKSSVDDNTLVFDRSGRRIGELFRRYQVYVPYAELPRPLVEAIVAIEDRNFFRHRGVDYRGMARALWKGLREGRFSQGASTLTQQLVRHFLLDKSKTLKRKVREIAYARRLERQMTKERILELYCNVLFLGNGAYGVGAAAMRYFGRPLGELTLAELAVIAGLFQSPSAYNPERFPERARARQRQVLDAMVAAGYLTRAQAAEAAAAELRYQRYRHLDPHPYFLDAVENLVPKLVERLPARRSAPITGESMPEDEGGSPLGGLGLRVHSTLDPALQAIAERTIADAPRLWREAQNKVERTKRATVPFEELEAALVAVDPATGEVLALVGGRDYQQSKFNRVTQSLRPPGSAFKPVVYALALQQGRNWNDVFYVAPVTLETYRPRNLTSDYLTETTLLRAFYKSLNTVTVELATGLGIARILAQAKRLGVETELRPEAGTSLGSSEVTLMDMARVFATFANEGTRVDSAFVSRIESRDRTLIYQAPPADVRAERVLSPQIAYLMTEGLRTVLLYGTGYASRHLANRAVGKTGTSNGAKDNWFCGYSPNLAVVVWVGTDGNAELPSDAMASTLALPLWDAFMSEALRLRPAESFRRPAGVRDVRVHSSFGTRSASGMRMYFLAGKEPKEGTPSALEVLNDRKRYRKVFE